MTMTDLLVGIVLMFLICGTLGALPFVARAVRAEFAAREAALAERHVLHMRGPVRR